MTRATAPTPVVSEALSVPPPDAPWTDIEEFALSFEPGDEIAELAARASRARRQWGRHAALPTEVPELRAYVFFEQRRWHHLGGEPDGRAREYVSALLQAIANASSQDRASVDTSEPHGTDDALFQTG